MAAPRPAGPPPTTRTSVSPPSSAWRGGSGSRTVWSGRFSAGKGQLFPVDELEQDAVRLLRALLQGRNVLRELRLDRAHLVPRLVDIGHKAARVDELHRRRRDLQLLQKATYLPGVGKRHERHPAQGGEDQEMQPHADHEVEP